MKAEEFMIDLEAVLGLSFDAEDERRFHQVLEQYFDTDFGPGDEWHEGVFG